VTIIKLENTIETITPNKIKRESRFQILSEI